VRSVFCDRAEPVRAQQVAVAGPRIPQACIGQTIWLAVQVPFEDQRGQAGVGDEVADRVVLSDLADRIARKSQHGAGAARSLENGIAVSSAPKPRPAGRATFRLRDAAMAQPAQSFGVQTALELLASSGQEIRKTCGVPAYRRVVIEKHRTLASLTMNAEPV
jgi:hypothetical protein